MSQLRSQVTISLPFTPGTPFQMQAAMKVSCHCASPGGISLPSLSQRQDSSRETGSGLLSFRVVLPYLGIRASITNEVGDNRGGQPLISAELGERESDRRLLFPPPSQGPQEAAWDICSQTNTCVRETHIDEAVRIKLNIPMCLERRECSKFPPILSIEMHTAKG